MADLTELALLEAAPDRDTAQMLLLSAVYSGADATQLRAAWHRFETRTTTAPTRRSA